MEDEIKKSRVVKALEEMIDNDEIQFEFDHWNRGGSLLAFVRLKMPPLVLKGFRIMESNYPNWRNEYISVMPPMIKGNQKGDFTMIFYIEDKELWEKLAGKIIDKYYQDKGKGYRHVIE